MNDATTLIDTHQAQPERTIEQAIMANSGKLAPAERRVADWLVAHPEDAVFRSAVELARLTHTSDATVIRTAKVLGFSGLPELKHAVGSELMATKHPARRLASRLTVVRDASSTALNQTVIDEADERLRETQRLFDPASFDRAVEAIHGAGRIITFGIGLSKVVAEYFAIRLVRQGADALFAPNMGFALADDLLRLRSGDVMIIFAPGRPTVEVDVAVAHARSVGASLVLITDSLHTVIGDAVDVWLRAPLSAGGLTGEVLTASVICDSLLLVLARRSETRATRTSKVLTALRRKLTRGRRGV